MVRDATASRSRPDEYEFNFRDWPFYWLARVDRQYHSVLERVLARISLDIPSWRVLMILHSIGTASVSEIAEHSIVKLSTMTKIIQRMEAEGFVSSAPAEHDRRVTMVTITAKGEEKGRAAWVESEKIKDRVFAGIALEDRDQMIGLLRKLSGQLSNY